MFHICLRRMCYCSVSKLCLTLWSPWTAVGQVPLSSSLCWRLLKFMSIASVILSNHLILYPIPHTLPSHHLFVSSIFPSIRVFFNVLALHIRWPKNWSFSFSTSPFNEYSWLSSFRTDCLISLQSNGLSRVFLSTTLWKH